MTDPRREQARKAVAGMDLDDLEDAVRKSCYADDRQSGYDLEVGLAALAALRARVAELEKALALVQKWAKKNRGTNIMGERLCPFCSFPAGECARGCPAATLAALAPAREVGK